MASHLSACKFWLLQHSLTLHSSLTDNRFRGSEVSLLKSTSTATSSTTTATTATTTTPASATATATKRHPKWDSIARMITKSCCYVVWPRAAVNGLVTIPPSEGKATKSRFDLFYRMIVQRQKSVISKRRGFNLYYDFRLALKMGDDTIEFIFL